MAEAAQAAERAMVLAQDRCRAGLVDFSNVLDAQRSLLSFQDQLARSEGTVTANLISLYKALGGGWTSMAPEEASLSYSWRSASIGCRRAAFRAGK